VIGVTGRRWLVAFDVVAMDQYVVGRYHVSGLEVHDITHENVGDGDLLRSARSNHLHIPILLVFVQFGKLVLFLVIVDRPDDYDNDNSREDRNSLNPLNRWISWGIDGTEGLV
jgi:hypothetical protein